MAKKWQLGDRVTSLQRLVRCETYVPRSDRRKTWEARTSLDPVTGILIGLRTLQNGHTVWLGEYAGHGWKQESTVRAALIATALHLKPVLVPLESLQPAGHE